VFFGGTGDLTWRKLMPALFQAFRHGKLPPGGRILAVARDERSDDEYRAFIRERFPRSTAPSAPATRSSRASPRCCTTAAWTCPARALRRPASAVARTPAAPTPWCCTWPPARTCSR
jgi:hypothetical protein